MKNIGMGGAGSITAAQFLQRFVNKVPWAHLDTGVQPLVCQNHQLIQVGQLVLGFIC